MSAIEAVAAVSQLLIGVGVFFIGVSALTASTAYKKAQDRGPD